LIVLVAAAAAISCVTSDFSVTVRLILLIYISVICRELLHSSQLDVSYFAGGIVCHLLADESTRHLLSADLAQELRDELVRTINLPVTRVLAAT